MKASRDIKSCIGPLILHYLESSTFPVSLENLQKNISQDIASVAREMILEGHVILTREWKLSLHKKESDGK